MTVFNHFARKEDMFFDREQEIHALAFDAVRKRGAGTTLIEAPRLLAHDLIKQEHPFIPFFEGTDLFVKAVMACEALKARARQMRDDFTLALARELAEICDQPTSDPNAHLAAGLIVATWSVAFIEAQKVFDRSRDPAEAKRCFMSLIDRGMAGIATALTSTAYVS